MADKKDEGLAESVLACILWGVAVVFGVYATGFTIDKLWGWHVTPAFGVPSPGQWTCYGLGVLAFFLEPSRLQPEDKRSGLEQAWHLLVLSVVKPGVALGLGYLAVYFRGY